MTCSTSTILQTFGLDHETLSVCVQSSLFVEPRAGELTPEMTGAIRNHLSKAVNRFCIAPKSSAPTRLSTPDRSLSWRMLDIKETGGVETALRLEVIDGRCRIQSDAESSHAR